jgi:hypothetical protein
MPHYRPPQRVNTAGTVAEKYRLRGISFSRLPQ